jgi:multiple sugar transport system ATP-binding protein
MSRISLQHIYKMYQKNRPVIRDLSLEIFENEFIVLVGPSGCGKTTTLRMIAGLEEVTAGDFYLNEVRQNDKDPSGRNLSFVFQNYALFPNLTVYENIEFGLLNKKMTRLEKRLAVEMMAKKLALYEKMGSYPSQLSGGQRQRVALARALVDGNQLVLFDEPLSNLDAVLRAEMRTEMIRFQKQYNVTGIYVTHDQTEAMTMASRIVLLIDGKIVQVGRPEQMYNNPNHLDVATFIGTPEINVLPASYNGREMVSKNNSFALGEEIKDLLKDRISEEIYYAIRPQDVRVFGEIKPGMLSGKIEIVENFGYNKLLHINAGGLMLTALVASDFALPKEVAVDLSGKAFVFAADKRRITGRLIRNLVLKDRDDLSAEDNQALRELANYGYRIVSEAIPEDSYLIRRNDDKTYEIEGLKLRVHSLKELLNHLSDIRCL